MYLFFHLLIHVLAHKNITLSAGRYIHKQDKSRLERKSHYEISKSDFTRNVS